MIPETQTAQENGLTSSEDSIDQSCPRTLSPLPSQSCRPIRGQRAIAPRGGEQSSRISGHAGLDQPRADSVLYVERQMRLERAKRPTHHADVGAGEGLRSRVGEVDDGRLGGAVAESQ